jgi:hypothetical protein
VTDAEKAELLKNLSSRYWRLNNLYWILNDQSERVHFQFNPIQEQYHRSRTLWDIILKARQHGFTTYKCLYYLDTALWVANTHFGIIAHNKEDASHIFKTKVRYPYDQLDPAVKQVAEKTTDNALELSLSNGSLLRVGSSLRSGTYRGILVSEFGKICARYPERAREIVTGAFPTVHSGGMLTVESTAEGREGYFYEFCRDAQNRDREGIEPGPQQFKFQFYAWWQHPGYTVDPTGITIPGEKAKYFRSLEKMGIPTTDGQRAWYVLTEEKLREDMKREYPSCIAGHVQVSTAEGLVPIAEIEPDGQYVLAKYDKGLRDTYRVVTKLGYEFECTEDHLVLTAGNQFRRLQDLSVGASVVLSEAVSWPGERVVGTKKGGVEVRIARKGLIEYFDLLGLLRRNDSGGLRRRIHVPDFVKRSPKRAVRLFLRGLFEADGFAQRNGSGIKFFTKYKDFARDVQLLLLQFGITCRRSRHDKKAGSGAVYEGWELSLRTEEARRFVREIGFLSGRKRGRIIRPVHTPYAVRRTPLVLADEIQSIEPAGAQRVYDITTATQRFSAGGVVVHNCPEEAFEASVIGAYFAPDMAWMRENGRITSVPWEPSVPTETAWDLGLDDANFIIWHQKVGNQHRIIDCYEQHDEGMQHYADELKRRGYSYREHLLPHDVENRIPGEVVTTRKQILENLGVRPITKVPRIKHKPDVIQPIRDFLRRCWIDKEKCNKLIKALDSHRREWDDSNGCFKERPVHDWTSHAVDALDTLARGWKGETKTGWGGGRPRQAKIVCNP